VGTTGTSTERLVTERCHTSRAGLICNVQVFEKEFRSAMYE
jgi:hypothetical protein